MTGNVCAILGGKLSSKEIVPVNTSIVFKWAILIENAALVDGVDLPCVLGHNKLHFQVKISIMA